MEIQYRILPAASFLFVLKSIPGLSRCARLTQGMLKIGGIRNLNRYFSRFLMLGVKGGVVKKLKRIIFNGLNLDVG